MEEIKLQPTKHMTQKSGVQGSWVNDRKITLIDTPDIDKTVCECSPQTSVIQ